jgi:outer membrane protein, heavy metal efflux system
MTYSYLLGLLLLLFPGCHRISINKEVASLSCATQNLTGNEIGFASACKDTSELQKINEPLSVDAATRLALIYNPDLQAAFATLGIAKADLVQAGFFTNPSLSTLFNFPIKGQVVRNETNAQFSLSDLWRVPLRKKVFEDQLEIVSLDLLSKILETMVRTHEEYYTILFYLTLIESLQNILKETRALKKELDYRQQFGLATDLDIHLANAQVGLFEVELEISKADLKNTYIRFRRLLGLEPSSEPISLSTNYEKIKFDPFNQSYLEALALKNRPELQIAHMKVQQASHKLTLERASIFRDVKAGISFEREFDNSRGLGPSLSIELPLFDQNQAQVARASFELEQATKVAQAVESKIIEEVRQAYLTFRSLQKRIAIYDQTILSSTKQGLEYARKFESLMQITTIILIQTKTTLYQNIRNSIETYASLLRSFAALERAVSKNLLLPIKENT